MQRDKVLHFVAGLLIAFIVALFFGITTGLITAILVGLLKELWDWKSEKGVVDIWDFIWTWAGGIVGALIASSMT